MTVCVLCHFDHPADVTLLTLSYIPDQLPDCICPDRDACNSRDDDANNTTAIFERLRTTR